MRNTITRMLDRHLICSTFMKFFKNASMLMLLFTSFPVLLISQNQGSVFSKVSITSPTAASLGKYADIPVNYNTGIASTSVPFYTVKSGPLSCPISLNYHASGLKVQENAGWVGAGWSLSAGGMITRTVRGLPDDISGLVNQTKAHYVHYGYSSYVYESGDTSQWNDWLFSEGRLDGEPDLFFFNVNGISGSFYFNDDRIPVLVPEQDIKIEVGFDGSKILGFTLKTSDGTKYYFGSNSNEGVVTPTEITTTYSDQFGVVLGRPISSWFVNKMESADGLFKIRFNYEREKYSYYTFSTQTLDGALRIPYPSDKRETILVKNNLDGVRLSQIIFPGGQVLFTPSASNRLDLAGYNDSYNIAEVANSEAKSLGSIQINNENNTFCKKVNFYYSYFNSDNVPTGALTSGISVQSDLKRLKLDSVSESSCDNTVTAGTHSFTYYGGAMPRRLSYGMDYWGFINGKTTNSTIIPTYHENTEKIMGADREPSWPEMQTGSLESVTYPSGGSTFFEYEPHKTFATYTEITHGGDYISIGGDGNWTRSSPDSLYLWMGGGVTLQMNNLTGSYGSVSITDPTRVRPPVSHGCSPYSSLNITLAVQPGYYSVKISLSGSTGVVSGYPFSASVITNTEVGVSRERMVGGLRIKKITSKTSVESSAKSISYTYAYSDGTSSGELYNRPAFVQLLRNDSYKMVKDDTPFQAYYGPNFCNLNGCSVCNSSFVFPYLKSGGDLRPMASAQGHHMGYKLVTKTEEGNGKTEYQFEGTRLFDYPYSPPGDIVTSHIKTIACDPQAPSYPAVPIPFDFLKGALRLERQYDNNNNVLKLKLIDYEYQTNRLTTPGYISISQPNWSAFYSLETARKTKETITDITYTPSGNDTLSTILDFGSSLHNQPTVSSTITSKQDALINQFKYSFDFLPPALSAISNGVDAYRYQDSTARVTFANAITYADFNHIGNRWTAFQKFKKDLAASRRNFINYRRATFSNPVNTYQSSHDAEKAAATAPLKSLLQMQDNFQNMAVEQSAFNSGKLIKSSFTEYVIKNGGATYPLKSQVLPVKDPSNVFLPASISGNVLQKDSRYKEENTLLFSEGNIAEITSRGGSNEVYLWGYNSQYPVAKIVGSNYTTVANALNQASVNNATAIPGNDANVRVLLNTLRDYFASNSVVQVFTYTYKPLVGVTSETDPTGHVIYYEYDTLGRLIITKDEQGNILKKYCYNYAGQPINCN